MKGGREHRVPLSGRAIALLRALPTEDGNDFVFLGTRGGSGLSSMAMPQVLKRMNRGDITVHGFRSQFPRLGQRDDEFSQPRRRNGVGACRR